MQIFYAEYINFCFERYLLECFVYFSCQKAVTVVREEIEREVKMAKNSKQTSKAVASKASRILRDGRYGKNSKSVAGSALAQTKPGRKK